MIQCPLCKTNYPSDEHNRKICSFNGSIDTYCVSTDQMVGKGDYSTVYKALKENAVYALKVFDRYSDSREPMDESHFLEFCKKQKDSGRIGSPCLVDIVDYAVWEPEGKRIIYVLSELCDESLGSRLWGGETKSNPMIHTSYTLDEAAPWFRQTAKGLLDIHRDNKAHGNLKPSNILFRGEQVKLSDFSASEIHIPAAYSLPNRKNRHAESRDDLYALGIIIFQTLFGFMDFSNNTAILSGLPAPLASWLGDVVWEKKYSPQYLQRLIDICDDHEDKKDGARKETPPDPDTGKATISGMDSKQYTVLSEAVPDLKWIAIPPDAVSPDYLISQTPVTNRQYDFVMKKKAEKIPSEPRIALTAQEMELFLQELKQLYLSKGLVNLKPRLPTCDEWEFAARARGRLRLSDDVIEENYRNYIETLKAKSIDIHSSPGSVARDLELSKKKLKELKGAAIETAFQLFSKLDLFKSSYKKTYIEYFSNDWFNKHLFRKGQTVFCEDHFHFLMRLAALDLYPAENTGNRKDLMRIAWYDDTASGPKEVRMKQPNDWDLYDMFGNVWELTADIPPKDNKSEAFRESRIVKGGSYSDGMDALQIFRCHRIDGSRGYNNVGFRLLLELP